MSKKIIVTGSSGYIGSLIVKNLLDLEIYQVVAVVRDQNNLKKYEFLKNLKGANERLSFAFGDLESADYNTIFEDAYGVIHTASPFFFTSEDVERDIVKPAISGNLRVLEAAMRTPTLKKLIITSSTAAVVDPDKKQAIYNEDDWNDGSSIQKSAYVYSKFIAEKSAWEFLKSNQNSIHFSTTFINPGMTFGPSIDTTYLNSSIELFKISLSENGSSHPMTQRVMGFIDVRDVAKAHIKALESTYLNTGEIERYVMASDVKSMEDIMQILQTLFPQYSIEIPRLKTPVTHYQIISKSNLKLDSLIDLKTTIKDTFQWLIQTGHYKPKSI